MPSSSYPDESTLIRACLNGDQAAWDELIARYGRLVFSIARRYNFTVADAEDIFQNVFTIAFKQLATLRIPAALAGWLAKITHHECQYLLNRARPEDELTETTRDGNAEPDELALFREHQLMVLQALSRLDARSRQLLTYLFLEADEPDYAEIALRLKMRVGSIGPTRIRALKKLEAILRSMGYTEEKR